MQSRCGIACGLIATAVLAMPPAAGALDLPAAPAQVKLKRSPKGKTFQVVFKRPSFFPAVGSADDPAVGTPGGMLIEVFSASEGYAAVNAPRGAGTPGWTSYPTKNPPRYKFDDPDAPDALSALKGDGADRLLRRVARRRYVRERRRRGTRGMRQLDVRRRVHVRSRGYACGLRVLRHSVRKHILLPRRSVRAAAVRRGRTLRSLHPDVPYDGVRVPVRSGVPERPVLRESGLRRGSGLRLRVLRTVYSAVLRAGGVRRRRRLSHVLLGRGAVVRGLVLLPRLVVHRGDVRLSAQ
jgi:hypothetical protein